MCTLEAAGLSLTSVIIYKWEEQMVERARIFGVKFVKYTGHLYIQCYRKRWTGFETAIT